jgi:hypothetical protein
MSKEKYNPQPLIPRVDIRLRDGKPYTVGGLDKNTIVDEVNFYTQLNSFAMKADVTIFDVDNRVLNLVSENNGIKVTVSLFEVPEVKEWNQELIEQYSEKVFQKSFNIDSVDVIKYDTNYPYKSKIKLKLVDTFSSNALNKLLNFSNFNLEWDSTEMEIDSMIHRILRKYEDLKYVGKMVIPDLFGVDKQNLKRRFATDCATTIENALFKYIDSFYNTRWYEFLSKESQPKPKIPQCLLAFGNQYTLLNGILRNRPYLTSMNMLDPDPSSSIYSIPYPKSGKILDYAHKDYDLKMEFGDFDLRGGPNAAVRQRNLAFVYRRHAFNPMIGYFEDLPMRLQQVYQLKPKVDFDVESQQDPRYWGVGDDPKFVQTETYNKKMLLNYPINIRENKHYISNGENSFYQDMLEMWSKPMLYVSIPASAWHSPGQEIDLRMTLENYDILDPKPEKEQFFSANKLISGRWKIINSVTNFKQPVIDTNSNGIIPVETLGLVRMKYLSGENK